MGRLLVQILFRHLSEELLFVFLLDLFVAARILVLDIRLSAGHLFLVSHGANISCNFEEEQAGEDIGDQRAYKGSLEIEESAEITRDEAQETSHNSKGSS